MLLSDSLIVSSVACNTASVQLLAHNCDFVVVCRDWFKYSSTVLILALAILLNAVLGFVQVHVVFCSWLDPKD